MPTRGPYSEKEKQTWSGGGCPPPTHSPLLQPPLALQAGRLGLAWLSVRGVPALGQELCAPALPDKPLFQEPVCPLSPEQQLGRGPALTLCFRSTQKHWMRVASHCSLLSPLHGGYPVPGPCSGHQPRGAGRPGHGGQADL